MDDKPLVLIHWRDAWSDDSLSLAEAIQGMQLNDIASLYRDFRSPSRGAHQLLRKGRRPKQRRHHCNWLVHCRPGFSRRLHQKERLMGECTEEAYWDELDAELAHYERLEMKDPVQLYYDHGSNAAALDSIHPEYPPAKEEESELNGQVWHSLPTQPETREEPQTITTPVWTLYLYRHVSNPTPSSPRSFHASSFTWHRNATGVWELGDAHPHPKDAASDPYGCTNSPLGGTYNFGVHACSCAEFPNWWRLPEETWRGALLDLVGGDGLEELVYADARHECARKEGGTVTTSLTAQGEAMRNRDEWTFVRPRKDVVEQWDVISVLSSTGSWRLVDVG